MVAIMNPRSAHHRQPPQGDEGHALIRTGNA